MVRKLLALCIAPLSLAAALHAQAQTDSSHVVFEPYPPNILRVTLSLLKDPPLAAPGYGFVASPSAQGWSHETNGTDEVYKSSQLTVTLKGPRSGGRRPPQSVMDPGKYFSGSTPGADI